MVGNGWGRWVEGNMRNEKLTSFLVSFASVRTALVVMYTYMIGQRKKALRAARGGKIVGDLKKKN